MRACLYVNTHTFGVAARKLECGGDRRRETGTGPGRTLLERPVVSCARTQCVSGRYMCAWRVHTCRVRRLRVRIRVCGCVYGDAATRKRNAVHNVHSTSRLINYSRRGPLMCMRACIQCIFCGYRSFLLFRLLFIIIITTTATHTRRTQACVSFKNEKKLCLIRVRVRVAGHYTFLELCTTQHTYTYENVYECIYLHDGDDDDDDCDDNFSFISHPYPFPALSFAIFFIRFFYNILLELSLRFPVIHKHCAISSVRS